MNTHIRTAKGDDLSKVLPLMVEQEELHARQFEKKKANGPVIRNLAMASFKEAINSPYKKMYVATSGSNLVGYILVNLAETIGSGYVDDFFVVEQYRRQGIGLKLMMAGIAWLKTKNVKCLTLDVYRANDTALAFYKKVGFRVVASECSEMEIII